MRLWARFPLNELTRRKIIIAAMLAAFFLYGLVFFFRFFRENMIAAEKRVAASVRVGIGRYAVESISRARTPAYPLNLDEGQPACASEANPLFTGILAYPGVIDGRWCKLLPDVYRGPSKSLYFYDKATGDFSEKQLLSPPAARLLRLPDSKITGQLVSQMRSRAVVDFSDGKKLIGGSVVLVPRLDGTFLLKGEDRPERLVSSLSGSLDAEVAARDFSSGGTVTFGYYTFAPGTQKLMLTEVFGGSEVPSVRNTFTVAAGLAVGFYFGMPGNIQELYFSQPEYNQDKLEHIRVFENPTLRKLTVAFDKHRSGRRPYQDMIVTVSY